MTFTPSLTTADLAVALVAATRGDVVTAHDPSYPAACFYLATGGDAPEIVVIAAAAGDVAAAVRLAARSERRVAVQATEHTASAGGVGTGVGTILVVTRLLARVSIDPEARTARMGAGSSWRQVLAAATPFGLVPVPSPVGSTHRGPRVRTFAFAPDRPWIRGGHLGGRDPADGRRPRPGAIPRHMRTGRTAFGLVTAMTIALQPAEGHYAGGLWFSASDAGPVPHRWRTWIADLPPTASTSIAQLRILTRRSSPEQVRGQAVLHVRLAFLGDPAHGVVSTTGAGLLA